MNDSRREQIDNINASRRFPLKNGSRADWLSNGPLRANAFHCSKRLAESEWSTENMTKNTGRFGA
jgi:hypothetical protein